MVRDTVISCYVDEPVECAVAKMYAANVGSVVVLERDGRLAGIVTERDIVRFLAQEVDLKTPLGQVARKQVITASPDEAVVSAAVKMIENNIRHMAVSGPRPPVLSEAEPADPCLAGPRRPPKHRA